MTDSPTFDEPDFDQHIRNVLEDVRDHEVDIDEAYEAITQHPGFNRTEK